MPAKEGELKIATMKSSSKSSLSHKFTDIHQGLFLLRIQKLALPDSTGSSRYDNRKLRSTVNFAHKIISIITSRDAYMLIYTRKQCQQGSRSLEGNTASIHLSPKPPARVMNVIREYNNEHDEACTVYKAKWAAQWIQISQRSWLSSQSGKCRKAVPRTATQGPKYLHDLECNKLYGKSAWFYAISNTLLIIIKESIIVSRQALESWLAEYTIQAAIRRRDADGGSESKADQDTLLPLQISTSDITCDHGALDPTKSKDLKRIALVSVLNYMQRHLSESHCFFSTASMRFWKKQTAYSNPYWNPPMDVWNVYQLYSTVSLTRVIR